MTLTIYQIHRGIKLPRTPSYHSLQSAKTMYKLTLLQPSFFPNNSFLIFLRTTACLPVINSILETKANWAHGAAQKKCFQMWILFFFCVPRFLSRPSFDGPARQKETFTPLHWIQTLFLFLLLSRRSCIYKDTSERSSLPVHLAAHLLAQLLGPLGQKTHQRPVRSCVFFIPYGRMHWDIWTKLQG